MLFNSFVFILLFLPLCLAAFHGLRRVARFKEAKAFLALASLAFYGWWSLRALGLLLILMLANYIVVQSLIAPQRDQGARRLWLAAVGIAGNLC